MMIIFTWSTLISRGSSVDNQSDHDGDHDGHGNDQDDDQDQKDQGL